MKSFIAIYLFLLVYLPIPAMVNAQSLGTGSVSVGDFILNNRYTLNQFTTAYGAPTDMQETNLEGHELLLYYDQDSFILFNDIFNGFDLKTGKYKINNSVGVGDNVGKIDILHLFNKKEYVKSPTTKLYYLYLTNSDADNSPICFDVTNNTITRISYLNLMDF